ncbi:MAG: 30S ribosome-binding factor RbfA [Lentisphaeria bacterium]
MGDVDRMRRVNEVVRREIGDYIEKNLKHEFKCLLTITQVKISPDLHDGQVYVSVYGGTEIDQKRAFTLVKKHRAKIQSTINRNMTMRNTPRLEFRLDDSIAHGDKILRMLGDMGL